MNTIQVYNINVKCRLIIIQNLEVWQECLQDPAFLFSDKFRLLLEGSVSIESLILDSQLEHNGHPATQPPSNNSSEYNNFHTLMN